MARQLEEIQKEYQAQAALLGHVQYQIANLQSDGIRMRRHMKKLNQEALKAASKQPVAEEGTNEQPASIED